MLSAASRVGLLSVAALFWAQTASAQFVGSQYYQKYRAAQSEAVTDTAAATPADQAPLATPVDPLPQQNAAPIAEAPAPVMRNVGPTPSMVPLPRARGSAVRAATASTPPAASVPASPAAAAAIIPADSFQAQPAPVAAMPPSGSQATDPAAMPKLSPTEFVALAEERVLPKGFKRSDDPDPRVARLQILLDRSNVSPGVIDGFSGNNLGKAVGALQNMHGLPSTGRMGPDIDAILAAVSAEPLFVSYTITPQDLAGPFVPNFPRDYAELAKLDWLGYRNVVEELAERFHMDEGFLRRLNPGATFDVPGTVITVADVGPNATAKVAHLVADSSTKQLLGYDNDWNLVVAYPATIGSTDMPSPSGMHAIKAVAVDPVYWYRPQVNFQQGKNTKALKLAPGPNNPVGEVWIGLDKPTYGIHGSPEPSKIDKTNSHGCLRLTNWDAKELVKLVKPGVVVEFVDPTTTASIAR
ncbi:L,D-transpeptidase [Kaistia dalseonensis]|uniref:Lipoprotein-anchoring transpeptidase ErfK/SrfK n=1 Tax=Kaistia dalseonensis TaxID=410840 RepID=A0ABU0H7B5_9HYPH|nr:L,D-transpeptidase [Kaistia dalseonensis]MCX5495573.1 L,D-transpeptidase [Kaistia dalseonensis]MDQ0438165.1 lipoprotein-anchoring transpeptidase ErfK/SrfK [Kaistia dalseonensis]